MNIEKLQELIDNAKKIVFFGGAGVSTESGLRDFRGKDGLYNEKHFDVTPETLLSINYFESNTENFFKYYKMMFLNENVKPNDAHKYLAYLEESGKDLTIITQNIDNLHQLAGSKNVIELHGSIYRNYSVRTKERFDGIQHLKTDEIIPLNSKGEVIRPEVTLYGEQLNNQVISDAIEALTKADLLIIAGTSLTVYPAANLIHYFKGNNIVAINRDPIAIKNYIQGDVGKIFKNLRRD